MDIKTSPPALTDTSKPWGLIRFIHKDGTERKFYSVINEMSGSRLSAFDCGPPDIDSMSWAKSVFRDIWEKAEVLEYVGTKHFNKKG